MKETGKMEMLAGMVSSTTDQCRAAVLCSHAEGQSGAPGDRSDRVISGDRASGGAQSRATRAIISCGPQTKPKGQGEWCRQKGRKKDEAYRPEVACSVESADDNRD